MTEDFISVAQINAHVGNFSSNREKILQYIKQAKSLGKKLVVFPELSICGYPPRDFLEFDEFIASCEDSVNEIAKHCHDVFAIVGSPSKNPNSKGKRLFNSAYLLGEGKVLEVFHKSLLPTYDVFDEYRYFEPNKEFKVVDIEGTKVGVAICEDLWDLDDTELYELSPGKELSELGAELIVNIAASPFSVDQHEKRLSVLKRNAKKYKVDIAYCNYVGAQTELVFDGGSMLVDNRGELLSLANFFKEQLLSAENPITVLSHQTEIERIHGALILGIRDYFRKLGFTKAILGLSGGIDSAVTYALAVEALGAENVFAVLLPSQYSSDHSVDDAQSLVENVNGNCDKVAIKSLYEAYEEALRPQFEGTEFGLAEENLQARIRGVVLMALSNKFGYILLNTSNKSEAAVGYGTLYGDMNGGLSVLGDVYKTKVFELARYINREQEIIPENSIHKPPSAELRPGQKDSDSLPDYEVLDAILALYIEGQKGLSEIVSMGYDKTLVENVFSMVRINEYKRYQTAPTLRVSSKAFGMGRRMPIVAKYEV